jgi:hypothetical protein
MSCFHCNVPLSDESLFIRNSEIQTRNISHFFLLTRIFCLDTSSKARKITLINIKAA